MNTDNYAKKWVVLVGVGLASFLGCIDFTIVNTALPAIKNGLQVNIDDLQWVITIFLLALCAFMVVMGRLADLKGRRLLLYIGMIGFGLSSLGAGLSDNFSLLLVFRSLQGLFTAILYTAPVAIVSNAFPQEQRGKAVGLLFSINGAGLALGPVFGGVIVSALSWHWVFLVNVPVIILSFMICLPSVKESRGDDGSGTLDWLGLFFLAVTLVCFALALIQSGVWQHGTTIGLLIAAVVGFVILYQVEARCASPIIKFDLFANKLFITSVLATFALGFYYCLAFFLMPLYLHSVQGLSGYQLGLMLLPTTVVMSLLSSFVGHKTDKLGPKPVILYGMLFFALSAVMQLFIGMQTSLLFVGLAYAAMGVGWAALLGPSTVATLSSVPDSMSGVATGTAWTIHNIGGVIGLSIGTVVYAYFSPAMVEHSFSLHGFSAAMWLLLGVMIVAALLVAFVMPNNNQHKHVEVDALGEINQQ